MTLKFRSRTHVKVYFSIQFYMIFGKTSTKALKSNKGEVGRVTGKSETEYVSGKFNKIVKKESFWFVELKKIIKINLHQRSATWYESVAMKVTTGGSH